jgi:NADH:ubiquinone oxidoreductase subunit 2 (subunit N)
MAGILSGQSDDPRLVLAVILVSRAGFKIAAVPFHMRAPDV